MRKATELNTATNAIANTVISSAAKPLKTLKFWVGMAVCATSFVVSTQSFAAGLDELHQFVAQVKSASGDFVQKQLKPVKGSGNASGPGSLEAAGTSSGTFAFARPGKFVWNYKKPYEQLLQADGKTLYIYDKDLSQVTERPLGNALGASPAAILFGSNDLDKNFTTKDGGTKDGADWVELIPKAQDTQFKRIGVGFKDGMLASMELDDVFGNVTLLTFQNIVKNPPMKADFFSFTPPKGADVIKG